MVSSPEDRRATARGNGAAEQLNTGKAANWTLHRWQVSFRSGKQWYPVGEFVALDAAAAIERAVEIFGPAEDHRAEEIPWDAAPLPRTRPRHAE